MNCKCFNHRTEYTNDNIFDHFSLEEYLSKPILINPCKESSFIYSSDIKRKQQKKENSNPQTENSIIQTINKNHFNIKIDSIEITYPNDSTERFIDRYKPLKFIGQGSFGLVIAVLKRKTNETFAVKIIQKSIFANENIWLENEVMMLKTLSNKRTMKLHEVLETRNYLFLFMDLIEGGSLKEFIIERYLNCIEGKSNYFITDAESAIIMKGILEGLHYMHKHSIAHRDLKPENIMFRDKNDLNSIIIGDFGIADDMTRHGLSNGSKCGTLIYMAFEMIEGRPYDQLVDLWACGIIMFILESGGMHPLYVSGMDKEAYTKVVQKKKQWTFPEEFPNLARNFFMKICKKEPFYRYHTGTSLKHPWIERKYDNQQIPLTLIDSFEKDEKVKKFKNMLSCFMFFKMYKQCHKNFVLKHSKHHFFEFDSPGKKLISMPLLKLTRGYILRLNSMKKSTPNLKKQSPKKSNNLLTKNQSFLPSLPIHKVKVKEETDLITNKIEGKNIIIESRNNNQNSTPIQNKFSQNSINSSCFCVLAKVDSSPFINNKIDVYSKKSSRNFTPGRYRIRNFQQDQSFIPIRKNRTRNLENSNSYKLIDFEINRTTSKKIFLRKKEQTVLEEDFDEKE